MTTVTAAPTTFTTAHILIFFGALAQLLGFGILVVRVIRIRFGPFRLLQRLTKRASPQTVPADLGLVQASAVSAATAVVATPVAESDYSTRLKRLETAIDNITAQAKGERERIDDLLVSLRQEDANVRCALDAAAGEAEARKKREWWNAAQFELGALGLYIVGVVLTTVGAFL